jgi:2-amino-4-hydroxy-6-hydroxymethyldihydropteridine diphosphokinase
MQNIYISLGANIGDPKAQLDQAISLLRAQKELEIVQVSKYYQTSPLEFKEQADFLNAVVWMRSALPVDIIHQRMQAIENTIGKGKTIPQGPRRIDMDILLVGEECVQTKTLQIPHLKMHLRRFVLEPMMELAPEAKHPILKKTIKTLWENLPHSPDEKVIPL